LYFRNGGGALGIRLLRVEKKGRQKSVLTYANINGLREEGVRWTYLGRLGGRLGAGGSFSGGLVLQA
jgi:hypothetical protein